MMMNAYIKAVNTYLPEKVVTNADLESEFPDGDLSKVGKAIGVESRHLHTEGETAGDMAVKAAKKLFEEYHANATDVDFILFCTQSPDYHLPSTACIIQDKLGISTSAGALDYDLGCSGYIYGLSLAKGLILGGMAKNVLLLTGDTIQRFVHPQDKGNRMLFGEAATATLISTEGFAKIGCFSFGTNGKGAEHIIVKTGGARHPEKADDMQYDESGAVQSSDYFYMNGADVFNFTLDTVPNLVKNTLEMNGLQMDDVDEFVFHQANKFTLNTIRKVCKIDKEKFWNDVSTTGNTTSSTVPIALCNFLQHGGHAKKTMLAGFGIGLSWAGCIISFEKE
jgi:3-oxoacyl-[acyl-carrier-protein] synthase-3